MNKWIIKEYPITEDGNLSGKIIGHQLIFNFEDPKDPEIKKRLVGIRHLIAHSTNENENIKEFEKKYGVKCIWESIGYGNFNHLGYKIKEKELLT